VESRLNMEHLHEKPPFSLDLVTSSPAVEVVADAWEGDVSVMLAWESSAEAVMEGDVDMSSSSISESSVVSMLMSVLVSLSDMVVLDIGAGEELEAEGDAEPLSVMDPIGLLDDIPPSLDFFQPP
jgi:hypothetical protein